MPGIKSLDNTFSVISLIDIADDSFELDLHGLIPGLIFSVALPKPIPFSLSGWETIDV